MTRSSSRACTAGRREGRACARISARVATAASLGLVKKYCWLSTETARSGGAPRTPAAAQAAARCRLRFFTAFTTAYWLSTANLRRSCSSARSAATSAGPEA
jgi:hypothetical protein